MSDHDEPATTGVKYQLHPLSPVIATAPVLPGLLIASWFIGGGAAFKYGVAGIPLGMIGILALVAVIFGYQYLNWRKLEYWFDDSGDFRVDSGVIYRNERRLQLSRLQTVDVVSPLIPRLFGMASLRIEVAGAGNSKAVLSFLKQPDADALRREIVGRAAGLGEQAKHVEAPETVIAQVPTEDLGLSLILRSSTVGLLLLTSVVLFVSYLDGGFKGLLLVPVTGGIPILMVAGEFLNLYGFTVATAGDGLRLRRGLLQTQSQTVPPGRVAAVDFIEPLLWRPKGWVRVQITIAGVNSSSDDQKLSEGVLLPVAPWAEAKTIFALVMPGVDLDAIRLESAPQKARWRAPFQFKQLGVGHSEKVLVTRRGWLTRHLSVVPHARTQSVRVEQGPVSRRLGLASMYVDVPPGPVRIRAAFRSAPEARELADAQAYRARQARARDQSTHWANPPTQS